MGAWIEIDLYPSMHIMRVVAPLVGAWIEILSFSAQNELRHIVAPLVGAWIEISRSLRENGFTPSLPSWERGLKFVWIEAPKSLIQSLPSWERGLKLLKIYVCNVQTCRSPRGSVD